MGNILDFDIAEVVGVKSTYVDSFFSIEVKSCSTYINRGTYQAIPANLYNKQIPLLGEVVFIVFGPTNPSADGAIKQAYYISTLSILSSMVTNSVIGIADDQINIQTVDEITSKPIGESFDKSKIIKKLQPYEGDYIFSSRFGSSIRFGSTINAVTENYYQILPNWSGETNNDPITVISNRHNSDNSNSNKFIVEDINTDASSIYLTSTQTVPFTLTANLTRNNNFNGSQLLGTADRIILSAKTATAVIDAKTEIVLNTDGEILLGSDAADRPIPHGDVLLDVLEKILLVLGCGYIDSAGGCSYLSGAGQDILQLAQKKLENLNSTKYKIKYTETE